MIDQAARGRFALLVLVFGQYGNESLGKGAFCKQSAQQVGDAEGDEKSVGVGRSAKCAGYQKLADQAGYPGHHRHA